MPRRRNNRTAKTKAYGQGSVYQRKRDGLWVASLAFAPNDRRVAYAHSEAEAITKLDELRRLRDSGNAAGSDRQPVGEFLDDWLRHTKRGTVADSSFAAYTRRLQYVVDVIGTIALGQLRPVHIRQMMTGLQDRGLAATTIRECYTLVRAALDQPFQDGIIDRNPAASVRPPHLPREVREAPTVDTVEVLLDACEGTRWSALFLLLGTAGMRVSEALALHWSDIAGDTVHIDHSLTRTADGTLVLGPTKTREARDNPLTPDALSALASHRILQAEARLKASEWTDLGLIFPGEHGGLMQRSAVNQALTSRLEKAGLSHFRVHDLRHFCATVLLENGMAPHAVAKQLGHRSPSTTMARYAHVTAKQQREGAERMSMILKRRA